MAKWPKEWDKDAFGHLDIWPFGNFEFRATNEPQVTPMTDKDPNISSMAEQAVDAALRDMEQNRRKSKKAAKKVKDKAPAQAVSADEAPRADAVAEAGAAASKVHASGGKGAKVRQAWSVAKEAALAVCACGLVIAAALLGVRGFEKSQLEDARRNYVEVEAEATQEAQRRVEAVFRELYQNLRTIGRLPGVRGIDRHAKHFSQDSRSTVQEIYNNLAQSVPLSEFYIVPVDMEPDVVDPHTGKLQEPIVTFDHLIVGKIGGDQAVRREGEGDEHEHAEEMEEVEIHEYRLMKRQLALFKEKFPTESSFAGLEYPAACGPQVVTCDNSHFDPAKPDDDDRSGLVYSVPFYGPDGALKGCISAVVLTTRLRGVIGDSGRALVHRGYEYAVFGASDQSPQGPALAHEADVRAGEVAKGLTYAEVIPASIRDMDKGWVLWAAGNEQDLLASASMKRLERDVYIAKAGVISLPLLLLSIYALVRRNHLLVRRQNDVLMASVTERTKELEASKHTAESANLAKSRFLASMSHEIRTPVTAILGYADIMREHNGPPMSAVQQAQMLDTIRNAGRHLLIVINDILDLSKIEAEKMTVEKIATPVCEILHEVESLMRARALGKGVALKVQLAAPIPDSIISDPTRLRQILLNLTGNAVKFTSEGCVTVTARPVVGSDGTSKRLVIDVEDTGPGMFTDQAGNLFVAFGQADTSMARKFGGSGLGLIISSKLAGLMGGAVTLEYTTPGKGSGFRLELPLDAVEGAAMISNLDAVKSNSSLENENGEVALKGRVLLAEDGPDNQRLIAYHLRKAGASVEVADNGRIALEMLAVAQAKGEKYDLLLTDMQMPEVDGYTLASTLRQRGSMIAIVALTAHAMAEDRATCLLAGCDDYASKPIDKEKLLATCANWISRPSGAGRKAA